MTWKEVDKIVYYPVVDGGVWAVNGGMWGGWRQVYWWPHGSPWWSDRAAGLLSNHHSSSCMSSHTMLMVRPPLPEWQSQSGTQHWPLVGLCVQVWNVSAWGVRPWWGPHKCWQRGLGDTPATRQSGRPPARGTHAIRDPSSTNPTTRNIGGISTRIFILYVLLLADRLYLAVFWYRLSLFPWKHFCIKWSNIHQSMIGSWKVSLLRIWSIGST